MDEGVDLGRRLPGRAAPYDHEGESRVGKLLGGQCHLLEALHDAVADLQGVREPTQDRLCSFTPGTPKSSAGCPAPGSGGRRKSLPPSAMTTFRSKSTFFNSARRKLAFAL